MQEDIKSFVAKSIERVHFSWKRVCIVVGVLVGFVSIGVGATLVYSSQYEERVLPGVHIGNISVGGMNREELTQFIQTMQNKLVDGGIRVTFSINDEKKNFVIYPSVVSDENARELVRINIPQEVEYFLSYNKDTNFFARGWAMILTNASQPHLRLTTVSLDKGAIQTEIDQNVSSYITSAKNASVIVLSVSPLVYEVASSTIGVAFSYEDMFGRIQSLWSSFETPEIVINTHAQEPDIRESDVQQIIKRLPVVIQHDGLSVTYSNPVTREDFVWNISSESIANWLEVQKDTDGTYGFGLQKDNVLAFLQQKINSQVNQDARDAKFAIANNGKVSEFQGSRAGIAVDEDIMYSAINTAILQRTWHDQGIVKTVALVTKQTEPQVKTGEVNNLGIREILGVGHSKFNGSPTNRIKNIRHAVVDKLNGMLIKPGEEFSMIKAVGPFDSATSSGYVTELVIKGDRIVPELGGGLCQVGTTMFRAAMNSGLSITQRRNHSLVVPYYNDLSNGNPGTDATIYDPSPDLRFVNDTGNYILIATEMNTKTFDLYFTLWGTSDGRKGYYTPPKVLKWIPTGPEQIIETTDIPVGSLQCQDRHVGAEASFTYIIEKPTGEKIERVFDSYYRPLPKICLKGVVALSTSNTSSSTPECTGDACPAAAASN